MTDSIFTTKSTIFFPPLNLLFLDGKEMHGIVIKGDGYNFICYLYVLLQNVL